LAQLARPDINDIDASVIVSDDAGW